MGAHLSIGNYKNSLLHLTICAFPALGMAAHTAVTVAVPLCPSPQASVRTHKLPAERLERYHDITANTEKDPFYYHSPAEQMGSHPF